MNGINENLKNQKPAQSVGLRTGTDQEKRKMKHGGSGTRLYKRWHQLKRRCSDPKSAMYSYYGERGISICPEWMEFINFRNWAFENGYQPHLQIDRINSDGNYEPKNCRFITPKDNIRNSAIAKLDIWKARNIRKFAKSKKYRIKDLAKMYGVSPGTIHDVISRRTWT